MTAVSFDNGRISKMHGLDTGPAQVFATEFPEPDSSCQHQFIG
jgi:hypothetical protein